MQCSICQVGNPEGARFCNQCGTFLYTTDHAEFPPRSFDEVLARVQRYLPQGLSKKILSQRDRIEGERRQVTVMFCDMEGFTALADRLREEVVYTVMGQIYEILIAQVHDYEGTINEMTGDGIMALFGAPIAIEDAPQRALWAARSIHQEIAAFNRQREGLEPIRMRIGIHSGPVVVGSLGNDLRVEFKAVGDTVNLASRMETLAKPGTTYVTQEVYKQTREMFEFENLGKRIIKGKEESIQVYKVLPGRKDIHRPRLGSERMIFSELVGRNGKLDKLELQVAKLINGAGSIINIIGEAGIGKSRLLDELKRREVVQRVLLLEGRAISMGRNLSFHPIVDLLKHWSNIRVEDDERVAFTKLDIAIRELFQEQAGEILPFIATLMGLNLPPHYQERMRGIKGESLEKLIRKNMRELFTRLSASRPIVIVIDDLHWSDKSSIELLGSLFRLAEKERILFINLFRPADDETVQRILGAIKINHSLYHLEIVLGPLDERKSEILIANMLNLPGVYHGIVGQIVRRTGGNPYFIEEVVRSFIDEGVVVVKNGKFEVTAKFSQVTIPNTINDVLMARIDRLEEETRDLLKMAAVIGRSFFYRVLSELAKKVRNLDGRLAYLKETQLIMERERMEELEYLFSHALAQETAYASILPEKCKALHMQVADTIEKVFAEKLHAFYGMLAYHYSRAENLEKAEGALIKAGEEALKSSASSEALHYYLEALNLYRKKAGASVDKAKVALLEKNIAIALFNRGQYEEAVGYFDKALHYYWNERLEPQHLSISRILSGSLHLIASVWLPFLKFRKIPSDQDQEAIDLFFKKIKALGIIEPKRYFVESLNFYKRISGFDLSHFELGYGLFVGASSLFSFSGMSFRISRKILAFVERQIPRKDIKSYIVYDFSETLLCFLEGNWQSIKNIDEELIKDNLNVGEIYLASLNLHWHCIHKLFQGDLATAHRQVNWLSEIAEVYENEFSQLLKLLLNTGLLLECRRLKEAVEETTVGIEFAKQNNFHLALIHFLGCKAHIHILRGEMDAADSALEQAEEISREMDTVPWQLSHFLKGKAVRSIFRLQEETRNGAQSGSRRCRAQARNDCRALLKQTQKVAQHRTEACRLMGVYYWLIQKHKRALGWWQKSIHVGEKLGARIQLSRTYFEVGQRLMEPETSHSTLAGRDAHSYLEKAEALFNEMDLQMDIEGLHRMVTIPSK